MMEIVHPISPWDEFTHLWIRLLAERLKTTGPRSQTVEIRQVWVSAQISGIIHTGQLASPSHNLALFGVA